MSSEGSDGPCSVGQSVLGIEPTKSGRSAPTPWQIHYNHVGVEACFRQACDTLYWPKMQGEIKDHVQQCSVFNEYAHKQQKDTMMSHLLPTRPWQLVSMDLFSYARQDFLLMVDHYSDSWEIDLLPDLSAEAALRRCKAQVARHGIPDRVYCLLFIVKKIPISCHQKWDELVFLGSTRQNKNHLAIKHCKHYYRRHQKSFRISYYIHIYYINSHFHTVNMLIHYSQM